MASPKHVLRTDAEIEGFLDDLNSEYGSDISFSESDTGNGKFFYHYSF